LLCWVVASQDLAQVGSALGEARYGGFLLALLCFLLVGLLLDALFLYASFRWIAGVGRFGEVLRLRAATELLMLVTLVAGLGGLVAYARKRHGVPLRVGSGLVLVDLLHEAAAIGILGLIGLLLAGPGLSPEIRAELAPVQDLAVGVLAFYGLCVLASFVGRRLPARFRPETPLEVFHHISLGQYAAFVSLKVCKNLAMGLFVAIGMACFGVKPPVLASVALTQVVLLLRGLPVTAFGIGVDQLTIPQLFGPWEGVQGDGALLGFAAAFTCCLVLGRALLGVPFVRSVLRELEEGRV